MKYVEVCIAQYDYEARTPDEITVHEDDTLYIIEKEDDDWWRAELKQPNGEQGPIGLIPANYMVEVRKGYLYTLSIIKRSVSHCDYCY